jgi:hypothetical protein
LILTDDGVAPGSPPLAAVSDAATASLDAVEMALAKAVTEASAAGRFDVVAQLARELEARRLARAGNVVELATGRGRRR